MKLRVIFLGLCTSLFLNQANALSLAPEEFLASRALACVLAEQSLGYLSEVEYGEKTHTVLDGFDETEKDNILAKALGYYDGLMFELDPEQVDDRLQTFVDSKSCRVDGYHNVAHTVTL